MKFIKIAHGMFLLAGGLLSGCAGPSFNPPQPEVPDLFRYAKANPEPTRLTLSNAPRAPWWSVFADPELDRLMARIAMESPGYEVALKRIEASRLRAEGIRTRRYPSLGYDLSADRSKFSGSGTGFNRGRTRDSFEVPIELDYELDLWGRIRAAVAAGEAEVAASAADAEALLLRYQAELAGHFFALQTVHSETEILHEGETIREKALALTRARFQLGDISEIDVALAETELAEVRAERVGLRGTRIALENAIAALVGDLPTNIRLPAVGLSPEPPAVTSGIPAEVLRRRPDVRAAEKRVEAEFERVGLSKKLGFPKLTLSGAAGFSSEDAGDLGGSDSEAWSATAGLSGPLYDPGSNRIAREFADVRLEQAEAAYRGVVIEAIRDVETALGAMGVLDEQIEAYHETIEAAQRTVALTETRYKSGLVDFFEVVNVQRTLLRNKQAQARILGERYQTQILLIRALGGMSY